MTSILKYGAAIYFRKDKNGNFDYNNPALKGIEKIYNKTFKMLNKLPEKTEHNIINQILGEKNIKNIILKKVLKISCKWKQVYSNDI